MNNLSVNLGETFFGGDAALSKTQGVSTIVSNTITLALSVAGIIFIVFLIMGGIGIMGGSSSDNPEKVAKGKQAVTTALVGFVVVFAAYWIVQLIQEFTGLPLL